MILTALVGNTNTRFGWFAGRRLVRSSVLPTQAVRRDPIPSVGSATGAAVASVVPDMTKVVVSRVRRATGREPLIVGPRTQTGIKFRYRRDELGADRVCVAAGARLYLPDEDVIIFDFGTATTVNVLLRDGIFAGGAILPGIRMSLDALATGTAALPHLLPGRKLEPVQHSTRMAIRAGVAGLFAGGIEYFVARIERDLDRRFKVLATGGAAGIARSYVSRIDQIRPNLANEGLAAIWRINRRA